MSGTQLLGRKWQRSFVLQVGTAGQQGLDLSTFAVRFKTTKTDISTPNILDARIYNVNRQTAALVQQEFKEVLVRGGYLGNEGLIFRGQIKQARYGRESADTTYLDIFAATNDQAFNFGVINVTLAAGASPRDMLDEIMKILKPYDVTLGFVSTLPEFRLPRARVLHGMVRDVLNSLAESCGLSWSIQDGVLHMVPLDKTTIGGQALRLSHATGLIGMAEQTEDGIIGRCLMDPRMFIAGMVQIDESSINRAKAGLSVQGEATFNPRTIAQDGIYKVLTVEHSGETRGQEWYTDFVCLARGDAGGTSRASVIAAQGGVTVTETGP